MSIYICHFEYAKRLPVKQILVVLIEFFLYKLLGFP